MLQVGDDSMLIHYELTDESTQVINAKVEAESSLAYIKAMNYVSKDLGVTNELQTGALRNGSVVKIFWFNTKNKEDKRWICYVLAYFFRKLFFEKEIVEIQDVFENLDNDDKAHIQSVLNKYSIDENKISSLNSNFNLRKSRSEYFRCISSCKEIKAIGIKHNKFEQLNNTDLRISACDFAQYIEELAPETKIDDDAKVYIVSPVIVKGKSLKWNGSYNGHDISFEMLSNQFKTDAQNATIDFRTGFFVKCKLQYEETINEEDKPIYKNYKVIEVYGYECDDKYVETIAGKAKKINDIQPSLFDGLDEEL